MDETTTPRLAPHQCPGCETYSKGTHKVGADWLCDYHYTNYLTNPYVSPEV